MSFSINTNVASLQAENYLTQTSNFQNQTIEEVTSGLRIVNSGDDAAGLAIANADRSTEAVLTQGIQNATNGQNELQIADGGMSSIGNLLDTARTLATESASGTFTGDRGTLNTEFQSVIGEINRQAQAIGLNQGGSLASNLSVFIGGGETSNGVSAAQNGAVAVNLSQATVDAKSLGLEGVQASGAAGTDIGTGSSTSVQNILSNSANQASISNNTTNFYVTGPGFSDTSGNNVVKLAVNLNGVTDTQTLVAAVNSAIQAAGNGNSQEATAFKNANITAAINTNSSGQQQLTFNSSSTAFQVQGGDQVATALLGNFSSGSTGNVANVTATASSAFAAPAAAETVNFQIAGAGLTGSQGQFNLALTSADTATSAVTKINTAIAANSALAATGIQAVNNSGTIQFVGHAGQSFQVATAGDTQNAVGFGSFTNSQVLAGGTGTFDYTSATATGTSTSATQGVAISLNGGATVDLGVLSGSATEATAITTLNNAFQGSAALRAAGITASDNGSGKIAIGSSNGTNFRMDLYGGTGDAFGFGSEDTTQAAAATAFAAPSGTESINLRLTGAGLSGTQGDISISLGATDTADNAVQAINTAIAANSTLAATGIQAVNNSGTIQFQDPAGQQITAESAGDLQNALGFGNYANSTGQAGTAGSFDYTSLTGTSAVVASKTQGVAISVNGGSTIDLGVLTGGTSETAQLASLNAAFAGNSAATAAGLTAVDNGGKVEITTTGGTAGIRVNLYGGTGDAFGFGSTSGDGQSAGSIASSSADTYASATRTSGSAAAVTSAYAAPDSIDSAGAQQTANASDNNVFQFTGLTNAGDAQTITLSAVDANGGDHSLNVNLNTSNASTLDQALSTINSAISASNDSTLEQIGAFKQEGSAGNVNGVEGITFMSAGSTFKVSLGASPASSTSGVSAGLADGTTGLSGGSVFTSSSNGTGSTADISNIATATAAVTALANAVTALGNAQAAVGNGENTLTYAINLASSQLTNLAASESSIRDANMATESANLTKSQIQLQAGIAALSQANSAPQQILTLLQH